jgi:hypothetical protein
MYVVDMKKIMKITLLALAALTLSTPGQEDITAKQVEIRTEQ